MSKMRLLGWSLIVFGGLRFARSAWLGYTYYANMADLTRQRMWIALGFGVTMIVTGVYCIRRSRRRDSNNDSW